MLFRSHLDARRADCFEGLELRLLPDGGTLITGLLRDQTELYAMLSRIRDLGVALISVRLVKKGTTERAVTNLGSAKIYKPGGIEFSPGLVDLAPRGPPDPWRRGGIRA